MRLCRFDDDRLGVVKGNLVHDASAALASLPALRWPIPLGDQVIANLAALLPKITEAAAKSPGVPLATVRLKSPVANPSKIIGAPINYKDHIEESKRDQAIAHGRDIKTIGDWGLFLKAGTALVGPAEGVALRFPDRRNDHEVELAVIIGKPADRVSKAEARNHIAGYAIGLDMTVRGPEFQCFRKSIDTYAVLGPWMVTADEIADPNAIDFQITVNGEIRQKSNARYLDFNVERLIEYASSVYTLLPGDVIMTGTPAGVSQVRPGDVMVASIDGIGEMTVAIRAA